MTNRETLIAYLTMKVAEEDWHGVADAAMDLRELDAEYRGAAKNAKFLIETGLVEKPAKTDHRHEYKYDLRTGNTVCACGHVA